MGYSPCGCKESDMTEQLSPPANLYIQMGTHTGSMSAVVQWQYGPSLLPHCSCSELSFLSPSASYHLVPSPTHHVTSQPYHNGTCYKRADSSKEKRKEKNGFLGFGGAGYSHTLCRLFHNNMSRILQVWFFFLKFTRLILW